MRARLADPFRKSGGRRFVRGRLEDGVVTLPPKEKHASGMLFSMKDCNCLVQIPASREPMEAGSEVEALIL